MFAGRQETKQTFPVAVRVVVLAVGVRNLSAAFAKRSAEEWEAALTAAGVGCAAAQMGGQGSFVSFDAGLRQSGLAVEYDHHMFGPMVRAAPPVSFSETPGRVAPPCARGQHNRSVLAELGYDESEITAFEAEGAVIPLEAAS